MLGCEQNERQGSEIFITSLYIDLTLKCNGILWKRHALHYTSTGLGIIPKKTFFFSASLTNGFKTGSSSGYYVVNIRKQIHAEV